MSNPSLALPRFLFALAATILLTPRLGAVQSIEPIVIVSGSEKSLPQQPQAAIDEQGIVHLVYGVGNVVMYCKSIDQGRTFEASQEIARVPNLSLGMRRGPRVVAANGIVAVSLIGGEIGKGRDGDLLAWYSKDGGVSWNGPSMVNRVTGSAREGLHAMAIQPNGSIWCSWLDLRNKKTELFVSKSGDGGKTWGDNTLAYVSPERNICECCHPTISADDKTIGVMFRNSLRGNRDMYVAMSLDQGLTFETAKMLGTEHWRLKGCPMDGGMMVVNDPAQFHAVWMREGSIFQTDSRELGEEYLGKGNQPWIAKWDKDVIAVWTSGKRGDIIVHKSSVPERILIRGDCSDPCVMVGGKTKSPFAIVCWESKVGDVNSIQVLSLPSTAHKLDK